MWLRSHIAFFIRNFFNKLPYSGKIYPAMSKMPIFCYNEMNTGKEQGMKQHSLGRSGIMIGEVGLEGQGL